MRNEGKGVRVHPLCHRSMLCLGLAQGALFVVFAGAAPSAAAVSVPNPDTSAAALYRSVSQNAIEQAWNQLAAEYQGYVPVAAGGGVPSFLPGQSGTGFSPAALGRGMARFFMDALWQNGRLLGTIIILAVLAAVLEALQSAFASQTVSRIAFLAVHLALLVLAVTSFHDATGYAGGAIDTMTGLMYGSLPVLLALIAASGGLTSAATFHPLIVFVVNAVALVVHNWVFPMIFFSTVLAIVNAVSVRYKVSELASFLRTTTLLVLGVGMSAFLGIMTVQGTLSSVADGVGMRTAKFVAGLVPFVGKALSDAGESIAGASLLVKDATGMAGAVALLLICAFPALKILALAIIYNGSAALLQPLGQTPIIDGLSAVGKGLLLVFAALVAIGLMFFFSIVITLSATNASALAR